MDQSLSMGARGVPARRQDTFGTSATRTTRRMSRFAPATTTAPKEDLQDAAFNATADAILLLPPSPESDQSTITDMDVDALVLQPPQAAPLQHTSEPIGGRGKREKRAQRKYNNEDYECDMDSIDVMGSHGGHPPAASRRATGSKRRGVATSDLPVDASGGGIAASVIATLQQFLASTPQQSAQMHGDAPVSKRARGTAASNTAGALPPLPVGIAPLIPLPPSTPLEDVKVILVSHYNDATRQAAEQEAQQVLRTLHVPRKLQPDTVQGVMLDGNANNVSDACDGAHALLSIYQNIEWRATIMLQSQRCSTRPCTAGAAAAEQRRPHALTNMAWRSSNFPTLYACVPTPTPVHNGARPSRTRGLKRHAKLRNY